MSRPGGPLPLRPRLLVGVVLAWSLLAFLPVIQNDFVSWDDYQMFLAVRLDPGLSRAHDYLGRALSTEGRGQEAETHLQRGQPWPPAGPVGGPGAGSAVPGASSVPTPGGSRPRRRRTRLAKPQGPGFRSVCRSS